MISVDSYSKTVIDIMIEPAIVKATYERKMVLDTLNPNIDYKEDILTLKIGQTTSSFYSQQLKTIDSLEYYNDEYFKLRYSDKRIFSEHASLSKEAIFKNYPQNKITHHDRFDLCNWTIEEDIEKPVWKILRNTKTILGYECIEATTSYRGRTWIVWFTPEIPISDGPWKLWGLPGLILCAKDSKQHYSYTIQGIEMDEIGFVEFFDYYGNRMEILREKALKAKRKYLQKDIGYEIMFSGDYGFKAGGLKHREKMPHANYDFEETDYPHE